MLWLASEFAGSCNVINSSTTISGKLLMNKWSICRHKIKIYLRFYMYALKDRSEGLMLLTQFQNSPWWTNKPKSSRRLKIYKTFTYQLCCSVFASRIKLYTSSNPGTTNPLKYIQEWPPSTGLEETLEHSGPAFRKQIKEYIKWGYTCFPRKFSSLSIS